MGGEHLAGGLGERDRRKFEAATALVADWTLATRNVRAFNWIPGLTVLNPMTDWEAQSLIPYSECHRRAPAGAESPPWPGRGRCSCRRWTIDGESPGTAPLVVVVQTDMGALWNPVSVVVRVVTLGRFFGWPVLGGGCTAPVSRQVPEWLGVVPLASGLHAHACFLAGDSIPGGR